VSCLELKDSTQAVKQLDDQMIAICRQMNNLCQGSLLTGPPDVNRMKPDQAREVDLTGATQWLNGGFPIMANVSLNWAVAEGPSGSWFVIGTHRRSLDDVVNALKKDAPAGRKTVGQYDSCGTGNGLRISRHLQSWSEQADKLEEPGEVEQFRASLNLMSDLAGGLRQCRWQLARPSANQMKLDIEIELSPPESAR
jgi:hypothetical protein